MPQVAKRGSLHFIISNAKELQEDQIIRVENHKNDRFLEIKKTGSKFQIKEDGYSSETHTIEPLELKSILTRLLEYEFPRSHKLRIKIRKPEQNSNFGMSPWSMRKIS